LRVTIGAASILGMPVEAVGEGRAVVAIRPEDLTPGADAPIAATVANAEYRGRDFYGMATTPDGIELYFRSEARVLPGEALRLGADPARVLVYAGSA
jgi:putative spermidine/putrescine transport system ATP-binding protein